MEHHTVNKERHSYQSNPKWNITQSARNVIATNLINMEHHTVSRERHSYQFNSIWNITQSKRNITASDLIYVIWNITHQLPRERHSYYKQFLQSRKKVSLPFFAAPLWMWWYAIIHLHISHIYNKICKTERIIYIGRFINQLFWIIVWLWYVP